MVIFYHKNYTLFPSNQAMFSNIFKILNMILYFLFNIYHNLYNIFELRHLLDEYKYPVLYLYIYNWLCGCNLIDKNTL